MKARKLVDSIKHEHGYCLESEGMPLRANATFTVPPHAVLCSNGVLCSGGVLCSVASMATVSSVKGCHTVPLRLSRYSLMLFHALGLCYALVLCYVLSRARLLSPE
jgi:hypothetical protein